MEKDILLFFVLPVSMLITGYIMGRRDFSEKLVVAGLEGSERKVMKVIEYCVNSYNNNMHRTRFLMTEWVKETTKSKRAQESALWSLKHNTPDSEVKDFVKGIEKKFGYKFKYEKNKD